MDSEITCNLCDSAQQIEIFPAGKAQPGRVVRCSVCGLMFVSPRIKADIDDIAEWDAEWVFRNVQVREAGRVEKQTLQRRDYELTRRFLAGRHPGRGALVEVGSSLGYLLDYFRSDGWSVLGVEPSKGWALYAEKELGIKTIPATLGESGIVPHSMDVVLMMHVIEHVPDPLAVLGEVRQVLKPGGTFVVETPRYDSLAFRLLRHRERSVSCNGHIYFFTVPTLKAMAEKAGFEVLRTDIVGRSMTLERLLYNLGVMSKSMLVATWLRRLSSALGLNKVSLYLNARDMVRMYLTPM